MSRELLTEADKAFIVGHYNTMSVFQMALRMDIKTESRKCPIIEDFIKNSGLKASVVVQPQVSGVSPPQISDINEVTKKIIGEPVAVETMEESPDAEECSIEECSQYLKYWS